MQRYRIVDYYDFPIDTVVDLLMETEGLYDLKDLPNVQTNTPIECRDEGDRKLIKNKWCVHGQIPKAAQKLIKPEMLTFVEDSVWDRRDRTYSTKIIPNYLANLINCRHKLEFFDNGDGRTRRVLSGFFELKVPIIGSLFELAVVQQLKNNAEEDFKLGNNAIKKYIAEHDYKPKTGN
jgi:hypothetical protein